MVVGYVLDFFPQLSETFVENEIRCLRHLGVDVTAVSMYPPRADLAAPTELGPERLQYRPSWVALTAAFLGWFLRRPVVSVTNVGRALRLRSQTHLRGAWSAGWIASHFRAGGVSHVHAHFAHDAAATGMVVARLMDVPFTFTLHAHELYVRTNGLCVRCRAAQRLVTVCEYNVAQLARRCPGLLLDHVVVIPCGVNLEDFGFQPRCPHDGPFRLLSVGRLVEIKGFDLLITAVAQCTREGLDVRCDIVGHGPLRAELEGLAEELGVADRVSFLGPLLPGEVAEAMQLADLFVLACRIDRRGNRDSMPVVIKEAMASGVPVLSTDEVAIPEMVDRRVGRLVPPDDAPALAAAIAELAALSAEDRTELGRAGRQRVCERFDVRKETARLKAVFEELARS